MKPSRSRSRDSSRSVSCTPPSFSFSPSLFLSFSVVLPLVHTPSPIRGSLPLSFVPLSLSFSPYGTVQFQLPYSSTTPPSPHPCSYPRSVHRLVPCICTLKSFYAIYIPTYAPRRQRRRRCRRRRCRSSKQKKKGKKYGLGARCCECRNCILRCTRRKFAGENPLVREPRYFAESIFLVLAYILFLHTQSTG